MMKLSLRLFVVFVSALIGACSLPGSTPPPQDHFYRLPPAQKADSGAQLHFDHIVIKPVQVSGLYHERAMLYVSAKRPLEIKRYHYHFWSEPPSQLVLRFMRGWLLANGVANQVSTESGDEAADLTLMAELTGFEQVQEDTGYQVRLAMDVDWIDVAGKRHSARYALMQPAASDSVYDTAAAFGVAMQRLMQQLMTDVSTKKS